MTETTLGPYRLIAVGLLAAGFFSLVYPANRLAIRASAGLGRSSRLFPRCRSRSSASGRSLPLDGEKSAPTALIGNETRPNATCSRLACARRLTRYR